VGRIYVSNASNNSIVRFDSALTVSGNATPGTVITGAATLLSTPQYLFVDVANNRLFVANQGGSNILVFDNANTQTGNAAPTRTISGPATQLFSPVDVALDRTRDLLYVADNTAIQVFANGSTATGNVSPLHSLSLGFTPSALFVDSANNRLFVADTTSNAVHVFDAAGTLNGVVSANRIVSGGTTQLNQPGGLQVDNAGRLIVSNFNGATVTFYPNAATANGNVAPVATITGGSTGMIAPTQIVLNNATTTGDLYLADGAAASVLIFANIGAANGNVTPTRTINGSNTGLVRAGGGVGPFSAKGIALDTSR
jgi:DNA-binding beta-propeller fold protein YncE